MRCERCYCYTSELYPYEWIDEETGEEKKLMICWDCDFELINNRGTVNDEVWEIWEDREEEEDLL